MELGLRCRRPRTDAYDAHRVDPGEAVRRRPSGNPTRKLFLTRKVVGCQTGSMIDVAVIDNAAAAEAALDPARARLLAQLTEPRSAAMLAAVVGLPRQKVNYHLRMLAQHGLVELVEERRKGNVTERLLQAGAAAHVISPAALAGGQPATGRARDPPC